MLSETIKRNYTTYSQIGYQFQGVWQANFECAEELAWENVEKLILEWVLVVVYEKLVVVSVVMVLLEILLAFSLQEKLC